MSNPEGALLGQGVAGFLAQIPIQLGAEEENEVDDEPDDGQHIVVPEETARLLSRAPSEQGTGAARSGNGGPDRGEGGHPAPGRVVRPNE